MSPSPGDNVTKMPFKVRGYGFASGVLLPLELEEFSAMLSQMLCMASALPELHFEGWTQLWSVSVKCRFSAELQEPGTIIDVGGSFKK